MIKSQSKALEVGMRLGEFGECLGDIIGYVYIMYWIW